MIKQLKKEIVLPRCPLDDLDDLFAARTIMKETDRTAVVLWAGHTYVYRKFKETPRLLFTSEDPTCGKSKTLSLLAPLSFRGAKLESTASFAYIRDFRVSGLKDTLCLDQLDGVEDKQLFNLFCSSTEVNAKSGYKEKVKEKGKPEKWQNIEVDVGYPVALGKIGEIASPALMSRCIIIHMIRETKDERRLQMPERMKPLPKLLVWDWVKDVKPVYIEAPNAIKGDYASRVEDIWQPLLNVARLAGPHWEQRAIDAMIELHDDDTNKAPAGEDLLKRVIEVTGDLGDDVMVTGGQLATRLGDPDKLGNRSRGWIFSRKLKIDKKRSPTGDEMTYSMRSFRREAARRGLS